MADVIRLLPDSVANQIAAGEVIQRPASVVKELVENAIDAKATSIKVICKDAGRTLIQVIDNGVGMSETDARMSFERHATSKIKRVEDIFAIRTMGFRGEALASIAAIASVELKTRKKSSELGTHLQISASEVESQEVCSCNEGSSFSVKNLFYNVPARRKFLKSNNTELRYIIAEFQRIALANPEINMALIHNDADIYNLPAVNFKQRIVNIFGKNINQQLIPINNNTSIAKITGYIGAPDSAKKTLGEQFFFVNNRFMKHPFLHKAIMKAYENIIGSGETPCYFINFESDPAIIDVNIHPTKTEIKFEDERALFQLLFAATRESLGKYNAVPSIDFDQDCVKDIHFGTKPTELKIPTVTVNPNYNPFSSTESKPGYRGNKSNFGNWEQLYKGFENEPEPEQKQEFLQTEAQQTIEHDSKNNTDTNLFQFKNKYILSPVKSGLMIIDQKRAHERILFDKFIKSVNSHSGVAQQTLFPVRIELSAEDSKVMEEILESLHILGFDIGNFGKNSFVVNGTPAIIKANNPEEIIRQIIDEYKSETTEHIKDNFNEKIAIALAKSAAIDYGKSLSSLEMKDMIDNLFSSNSPNYTPDGKIIITIIKNDELDKKFE